MPVTVSSGPAADSDAARDLPGPAPVQSARARTLVVPALLALVVGAMAAVMYASHRAGHWWGDDWALYLRQAKSLLDGDPGRIAADNRFTVEASEGPAFSPPLYPWGFPMLLVPFVAVVGTDLDTLTIVPVLCACVFACCWFDLARRRLGSTVALVGTVAVTITPLLLSWTELIQSEWPFLATTGVALVVLDRAAARGRLLDGGAWTTVGLGVAAAAAFTVRREGLAVVGAIAAAQLAALVAERASLRRRLADEPWRLGGRLLAPHVTALAIVLGLQAALPSTLVPRYEGTGLGNVTRYATRHVEHLAQVSGLQRPWDASPVVLGSGAIGWVAVVLYLVAALVGAALALTLHRRRDAHLLVYAIGAFLIGASFRVAINRYVATVGPVLLLLALVALRTVLTQRRFPRLPAVATGAVVVAIALGNLANAHVRIERAETFAANGSIEWGPTHPDAIEMFDEVIALTRPDDIVAAPKARAMTLLTDRRSVQVDESRLFPDDVDVAIVVVERNTATAARFEARRDRFRPIWRNARFVIYEPIGG